MTQATAIASSSADFVQSSTWFAGLPLELQALAVRTCSEKLLASGDELVRMGDQPMHWIGVCEGLLHMWVIGSNGQETTLAVIGEGEWCAEGTLIKRELYLYNAVALTPTKVVLIPAHTFDLMRNTSIPFNHAIQTIMNDRMAGFVQLLAAERMLDVEARVELCLRLLAAKQPSKDFVRINQQRFALLCGLSRQRVNLSLKRLQSAGRVQRQGDGLRLQE